VHILYLKKNKKYGEQRFPCIIFISATDCRIYVFRKIRKLCSNFILGKSHAAIFCIIEKMHPHILYNMDAFKFLKKYIPEAIVTVLRAFTNASSNNFFKNKICTHTI